MNTFTGDGTGGRGMHPPEVFNPSALAGPSLELKLPSVLAVDHVATMEDLREGQKIAAYTIEARQADGAWTEVAKGESVGHKRIDRFPEIRTDAIRFTCTRSFADPVHVRSLAAFSLVQP